MRRFSVFLTFVLLVPACFAVQRSKDALIADPEVHQLLMENEHIRVFEARASHGIKSPMHSHPPMVFISLDTARVKLSLPDGKTTILDTYPGQVLWFPEGLEHSWQLLNGQINVIAVEIKSASSGGSQPLAAVKRKANDSVTVDPDVHHVLFENDHVRVFDGRGVKGRKTPMHTHPPTLLVPLAVSRMRLTQPDGKTAILDFSPGKILWAGDGMEHSWEMLAGDAHVIAVEVKSAQRAMQAKAK